MQRLDLADGRRLVYKSQLAQATIEPAFCSRVRSPILVACEELDTFSGSVATISEYLDAPVLASLSLPPERAFEHLAHAAEQVRAIDGLAPVSADISTPGGWESLARGTLDTVDTLRDSQAFHRTSAETAAGLRQWAASKAACSTLAANACLIHGDLRAANVFVLPDGYRVIDWQRPLRGPRGLDEITAWVDIGLNPLDRFDPTLVQVWWFWRLSWLVQCKAHFFRSGSSYDAQVAQYANQILTCSAG